MIENITLSEFDKMIHAGLDKRTALIDVRTPEEYATLHIKGAINIPYQLLPYRYDELESYDTLILYCSAGIRSELACDEITLWGKKKLFYLKGKKSDWDRCHLPLETNIS